MGQGPMKELTKKTCTAPEGPRRLADELKKTCEVLETQGSLQILKVPLQKDQRNTLGCRRFTFGSEVQGKKTCTIIMMGATGSGKSTLINGMINYILGVQWTDSYRFKLVVEEEKSQSQTSEVTVYRINFDEGYMIDYSLNIIDTPGFGDTCSVERDHEITAQIWNLFSDSHGVDVVHTVCFVPQSALTRLSATQRYVFDSVLFIFGKDVAENFRVLVTFADRPLPPVLEAITAAGVPCPKDKDGKPAHYKFNNSALFAENQNSVDSSDEMFWDMGKASKRSFFTALNKTEPKSLTLTKEHQLRKQLEEAQVQLRRVQRSAVDLTLDPDTANPSLVLSEDLKQVHHSDVKKQLPDSPLRFDPSPSVLGKQGFSSGRFYFEVQVKGKTEWDVGVVRESITRKGKIYLIPEDGFWCIRLRNKDEYTACAGPSVRLSLQRPPQKVGVFVDHEEALVSFYDVHSADLLYSFTGCSFTETLFPFFNPCFNEEG